MNPLKAKRVVEHLQQNHNRTITEDNMRRHIRAYQQRNRRTLTEADLKKFVNGLDVQKMPLTSKGFRIIVRKLRENLRGPNVIPHQEIANLASPNSSVSVKRVRDINREIKRRMVSRGLGVKRTQPTDPAKVDLPKRVMEMIQRKPSLSLLQAVRESGLGLNAFNVAMERYKTTFRKIQQQVLDERVKELGTKIKPGTNRQYTATEIAEELGLTKRNVTERRARVAPRGRTSGTAAQIESIAKEALNWVELTTRETSGVISHTDLIKLTQSNPLSLNTALKRLKKEGVIREVDTTQSGITFPVKKGERYFFVTRRGIANRVSNGISVRERQSTIGRFTIPQIDKMLNQLRTLRETKLYSVPLKVDQSLKEERNRLLRKKIGLE
jgi:hypothetical protein